ncbi:hypothetical protein AB0C02_15530 [Micromonospora sp. NPDC048999]|uniref:hypothetical protein n=1 Tax=Micromonospora sp. NPDC048999 TaxID=3155391 RepID=UPI0033F24614
MGNGTATRVLLLVVAILAASLIGMIAGWVTWANQPSAGKALLAGGGAFGGAMVLMITAFNFVMSHHA